MISHQRRIPALVTVSLAWIAACSPSFADEGGVSFWVPGQYGSFAAIAPAPGFSLPLVTYGFSGSAERNELLQRGDELELGADSTFLSEFIVPSYAPEMTIFGGKPNFSLTILPAYNETSANASLGDLRVKKSDNIVGIGDLYPTAQLFWSSGVSNWMFYVTGDIPVGAYDPSRLSNIGMGHGAVDFGGAYTFLDPSTGWEASGTVGLTFNFENPSTDYTNGIDAHFDWGVSKFLTENFSIGGVGYVYEQLTPDHGQPAVLGDFESHTIGIGPQLSYNFDIHGVPIYANLRGYYDFDTEHRLNGPSAFLTLNLPISALAAAKRTGD